MMGKDRFDVNVLSINDVIKAYDRYSKENSEEVSEVVLYFVSELTGVSIDRIGEILRGLN